MTSPSQELLRYFAYDHLPEKLQAISQPLAMLAKSMDDTLPDGPEKTMGLRKLLEAKDCFVRAALPPAPAYPLIPKDTPGETGMLPPRPTGAIFQPTAEGRRCECGKVWMQPELLVLTTGGITHDRKACHGEHK